MTCLHRNKQGTQILLEYCAGTLDPEQAGAIESHARECASCRELIASQKNLWSVLDELPAPEISADFDVRLYARIAQEDAQPAWRAWWNRISFDGWTWKPALAGVAAAAVLAVGLSFYMPSFYARVTNAPQTQNASPQIRPDSVDVEQLDVTLQDLEMLMPPSASSAATSSGKM